MLFFFSGVQRLVLPYPGLRCWIPLMTSNRRSQHLGAKEAVEYIILPMILRHHERLHVVLFSQDPIVRIRDLGRYPLKHAVAHRV